MSQVAADFEFYLLKTLPRKKFLLKQFSAGKVAKIVGHYKLMAEGIKVDWKVRVNIPDSNTAVFYMRDKQGNILNQTEWNEKKYYHQAIFVSIDDEIGVQGVFFYKEYLLLISTSHGGIVLFKDPSVLYKSSHLPKDAFHAGNWAASLRNARQYGHLVYFITQDCSVVEFSLNIPTNCNFFETQERTILSLENVEDFWIERKVMHAITSEGLLLKIELASKMCKVLSKVQIKRTEEQKERSFSSIEGCREYLVVSDRAANSEKMNLWLLSKKGFVLDYLENNYKGSNFLSMNVVHSFRFYQKHLMKFLIASCLFEEIHFFFVNGGTRPRLIFIDAYEVNLSGANYGITPLHKSSATYLISAESCKAKHLTIVLNQS